MNYSRRRALLGTIAALGATTLAGGKVFAQSTNAGPSAINVHFHLAGPRYIETLHSHGLDFPPTMTTERALADMDGAGVAFSFLSIPQPGVWFGNVESARRLARDCNQYAADLVSRYPRRFGFFAVLPLPDVEGALREIAYALDTLKADGIALFTSYGNKWLGDVAFRPLFDELNRRKALVYTHPVTPECCSAILPELSPGVVEYGTDTTRTIASLVFNGVAARCPDMRIIFSHGGGTMTSLIDRFVYEARRNPQAAQNMPKGVLYELRRFYYDTAQVTSAGPMSALLKTVPLSQVLFGSDFPFRQSREQIDGLRASGVLNERDLRTIMTDNEVELVPRLASLFGAPGHVGS
jgi:6-methylsalicylate decarboxylase